MTAKTTTTCDGCGKEIPEGQTETATLALYLHDGRAINRSCSGHLHACSHACEPKMVAKASELLAAAKPLTPTKRHATTFGQWDDKP